MSDLEGPMDDDAWLALEDAEEGGGAADWVASRFGYGDDDVVVSPVQEGDEDEPEADYAPFDLVPLDENEVEAW